MKKSEKDKVNQLYDKNYSNKVVDAKNRFDNKVNQFKGVKEKGNTSKSSKKKSIKNNITAKFDTIDNKEYNTQVSSNNVDNSYKNNTNINKNHIRESNIKNDTEKAIDNNSRLNSKINDEKLSNKAGNNRKTATSENKQVKSNSKNIKVKYKNKAILEKLKSKNVVYSTAILKQIDIKHKRIGIYSKKINKLESKKDRILIKIGKASRSGKIRENLLNFKRNKIYIPNNSSKLEPDLNEDITKESEKWLGRGIKTSLVARDFSIFTKKIHSNHLGKKINNVKYKKEKTTKFKALKKDKDYINSSKASQFFKRRRIKKQLAKKYNKGFINRFKTRVSKTAKAIKNIFLNIIKKTGIFLMIFLALFMFLSANFEVLSQMIFTAFYQVTTSTYLSSEDVLQDINNEYSNYENVLSDELSEVKARYPNYDEYIMNTADIGHDVHILLSYITAKYGEVKDLSEVQTDLKELFDEVYDIRYEEEIEIKYKEETTSYVDEYGQIYYDTISVPYEYKKLIVTLTKADLNAIVESKFIGYDTNLAHYKLLLESHGNMDSVFGKSGDTSEVVENPKFQNPGIEYSDSDVAILFNEAEKHIGKKYIFGASGPNNFDCSGFICWSYTKSGFKNMPRTTAWGIFKNYSVPISPDEARAGDLVFFGGTYNSGTPVSHIGIYAGDGMMLHAGNPIQYTSINSNYWKKHFYSFGRVR